MVLRVELRLADAGSWLKVFDPRDSTIFVAAADPPEVGEAIRVDLFVGQDGPRVIFRGQVIARRAADKGEPGYSVALGPYEREKINYLNGFVRGGLLDLRSRRRLPIRLPVSCRSASRTETSHSRDVNEEAVFVITERPLPEDTEVELDITVPGVAEPVRVSGVVFHTVLVEDEDVPGMGIRFRFTPGQRESFTALIDELQRRFNEGDLPDDCLL